MFRLIKLALYGLVGYALYELFMGMTQGGGGGGRGGSRSRGESRELDRALNSDDSGRLGPLTGPGIGERTETQNTDGGSVPHQVGRGVVTT